jgi:hypothetical protein
MLVSSFVGLGKVAVSTSSLTKEVVGGPTPRLHLIVADGQECMCAAITVQGTEAPIPELLHDGRQDLDGQP